MKRLQRRDTPRVWRAAALALLALALLAYLRDPPWLLRLTSGLGPVETDDTSRWRTMGGHASFFVSSDARTVTFPLRIAFDTPQDSAVTASIAIDDVPVERVRLTGEDWRVVRLRLPPRGSRKVRRIDVRVDRTRAGNRGPHVGLPEVDGR